MPGWSGSTQPSASLRAADRVRIADIKAQILEGGKSERSMKSLTEEQNLLQDRLNAYTYPVLTLPNEIVSEIFVHFLPIYPKCPPPIGPLSPYILCQICQKWRAIALATHALWRAISLSLHRRLQKKYILLDDWLGLSGSCLLSVKLHNDMDLTNLDHFGAIIAIECERWEYLELDISRPLEIFPVDDDDELALPHLRSLKLGETSSVGESVTVTFLAAPLLQKVALEIYCDAYGPIFPWSQLTVLSVNWIDASQCVDLLKQTVNVVCCRFSISFRDDVDFGHPNLILPHLETVILHAYGSPIRMWRILDTLTLPALRRLQVNAIYNPDDHIPKLVSLISRSECSLRELCVAGISVAHRPRYQAAFPSVSSFVFDGNLDITEPFLEDSDDRDVADSESEHSDDEEESGDDSDRLGW